MPRSIILLVNMQPHQSQPNQPTQTDTNQLGIKKQSIPILNAPELSKMDTEEYFRQYKAFLSQFQGNVDCRVIPSRKGGDTFTLTKAGAEKICLFLGLNYSLIYHPSSIIDYANNFYYYAYECQISRGRIFLGNSFGSCNNRENKYVKSHAPDILHTISRMAQKRALIGAVIFVSGGSRYFGQKLSDLV